MFLFDQYIRQNHSEEIIDVLSKPDEDLHYSIIINFLNLYEFDVSLGNYLLSSTIESLKLLDQNLIKCQELLFNESNSDKRYTIKKHIHGRITNLPVCPEIFREKLPRTSDIRKLLCLTGTTVRISSVKILEGEKQFNCGSCSLVFPFKDDFEHFYDSSSLECPSCGNCLNISPHSSKDQQLISARNFQEIRVQELVGGLGVGNIPRSISVILLDDLVDSCQPGDDLTVCGVVLPKWTNLRPEQRGDIELILYANNIEVLNKSNININITKDQEEEFTHFWEEFKFKPLTGRNKILSSLCPQVYGLYVVKLAIALVLSGGVPRVDESGTKIRGESHLLLVGDPGTGKSQFLKYASKVIPRSIITTGIGSTSAGLTVTAVRDGSEWQLEAGALVLADGGICCIDEFNSIREHDKASIHEAMEQQSISIAKAGMVCSVNTRTTVLAATNPKGQYDKNEPLNINTALASPLLSRFDLVLVLLDSKNEEWDKVVSSYILAGTRPTDLVNQHDLWSIEKVQSYLSSIKSLSPTLTDDASRILKSYFKKQRMSDNRSAARTTTRLLESMIRLSQAHARLLNTDEVTVMDAVVAVSMMESSMQSTALLGGVNPLHTNFPPDAESEYKKQAELILTELELPDILQREKIRLEKQACGISPTTRVDESHLQTIPITDILSQKTDLFIESSIVNNVPIIGITSTQALNSSVLSDSFTFKKKNSVTENDKSSDLTNFSGYFDSENTQKQKPNNYSINNKTKRKLPETESTPNKIKLSENVKSSSKCLVNKIVSKVPSSDDKLQNSSESADLLDIIESSAQSTHDLTNLPKKTMNKLNRFAYKRGCNENVCETSKKAPVLSSLNIFKTNDELEDIDFSID